VAADDTPALSGVGRGPAARIAAVPFAGSGERANTSNGPPRRAEGRLCQQSADGASAWRAHRLPRWVRTPMGPTGATRGRSRGPLLGVASCCRIAKYQALLLNGPPAACR